MKRICVYCGSSFGKLPVYEEAAKALGKALTDRGIGLVYGGASVGITQMANYQAPPGSKWIGKDDL